MKRFQTLRNSVDILNSVFILLLAAFLLDLIIHSTMPAFGPVALILYFIAKVYLYSGLCGVLIELVSAEEIVLSFKNFKKNVKSFWKIYAVLFAGITALHQMAMAGLQHVLVATDISSSLPPLPMDILLSVGLAYLIILRKYIKPYNLSKRRISADWGDAGILLGLVLLDTMVQNIGQSFARDYLPLSNMTIFLAIYIDLLIFIYLNAIIIRAYPEIQDKHEKNQILYFINPLSGGVLIGAASAILRLYPPAFAILKALSPKHYKARVFNRIPWRNRYYKPGKLVAITSYSSNITEAYKIAKEFRKRGSKVVMGGPHVTYYPDEALNFCDSVVIGEAEGVWKQVIKDFESDTLQPKYSGPALEDWHSEVHKELLNFPPEIIKDCIETTRGCKFHCDFCTIPSLSGGRARHKPIHEVVELIEKIRPYYKDVILIDNNIYSNPAYARDLFKALKPLKIKWASSSTIDIVKNEETLRLAKESGCSQFLFGYEIFGGSLETKQRGKFALADKYITFTKKIKDMGIQIKGTFILGFDSDNWKSIFRLWRFCFRIHPFMTNLSILTPLPGSRLYHQFLEKDRTTNLNWRNYDCHNLVFRQKNFSHPLLRGMLPVLQYFFFFSTSQFGNWALLLLILAALLNAGQQPTP